MLQKLVDYVIRPKRVKYSLADDLGPGVFLIDNKFCCERLDFETKNKQGKALKCSLFHRSIDKDRKYPLIIYCHGNSGNRTESYDTVCCMLRMNILVISFDFAGCGLSEGSHISLGHNEQNDLESVFNYVKNNYDFIDQKRIGIWGRSMGAVASLLFAASEPSIRLLVLDSPFTDLSQLMKEYIDRFKIVSKIAGNYIYKNLRKKIIDQAGFDFETVSPVKMIDKCQATSLFIHGTKDSLIPINHSKELFQRYPAEKIFLDINAGHNDIRSGETVGYISDFIIDKFSSVQPVIKPQPTDVPEVVLQKNASNLTVLEQSESAMMTIPEEKMTNREYGKYFDVDPRENQVDDQTKTESQPFKRGSRRRGLYYESESINQSSEVAVDLDERQGKEQNFVRALKTSKSVELTVLLASRKAARETIFLKSGSATIAVTQCDAEQMASMVNIFEKMNEDDIDSQVSSPGLKSDGNLSPKKKHEEEKFRVAINDFCDKTLGDDANITADDMTDYPTFAKGDVLEPFIQAAAGNNFELFRQKKENFSKVYQ